MGTFTDCLRKIMGSCIAPAIAAERDEAERGIIYDMWITRKTNSFAENLQTFLMKKGYDTSIRNSIDKELYEGETCPIIALCLLHSRIEADVNYTLADLDREKHTCIILVLLHFRKDDTMNFTKIKHLKQTYPDISVHNCFLQQDIENIETVNEDICKDLERREIKEIRKRQRHHLNCDI